MPISTLTVSMNDIGSEIGHYITHPGKDVTTNGLGVDSLGSLCLDDRCCLVEDWNGCCLSRLLALRIPLPGFLVGSRQFLTLW
jgi:hypothetical protein